MEKGSHTIHSESEQPDESAVDGSRFRKRSRNGSTTENASIRDLTGSSEAASDTRDNSRIDSLERNENEDESGLTLDLNKQPTRSSCWQHF
jgi:hypothetical protein